MNQLLFRGKTRHIPNCEFNRRVVEVNTTLKQAARHLPWLIYWKHKGLKNGNVDPYRNDQVHLNGFGMEKYVLSVRGAVLLMSYMNPIMLWGESKYIMFCLFYIMHIKNILARVVKRSCEQSSSGYQSVISKRYANEY